jgi:protein TonB
MKHSLAAAASLFMAVVALAPATFAAKRTLNAYFPVNFKDAGYQKSALDKVLKLWPKPPKLAAVGQKTVVQTTIGRDGKLIAAIVSMKSGVKEWDDAALAAVKKAAPFGPFPGSVPDAHVEVHWHFAMVP